METTSTTAKPHIRRSGQHTFEIASRTRPGLMHTVNVLYLRCSCEAGQHGIRCWHLAWALQAEHWFARAEEERKARLAAARPEGMAALQELYA